MVVGTLLGTLDGSLVEIQSCFAVPQFYEQGTLVIDNEYMLKMMKFHKKVNPKEGLVGMYISQKVIDEHGMSLISYFSRLFQNEKKKTVVSQPLIMLVDPTLDNN